MKKMALFAGMLVMLLAFGMTVVGCDNDSTNGNGNGSNNGTQNPDMYLLRTATSLSVAMEYNTNHLDLEDFDAVYDFSVFINGAEKTVDDLMLSGGDTLWLGILETDSCTLDTEYTVKVIYIADPDRIMYFDYGADPKILLESFTIERKLKCIPSIK